jgi:hypothetical protein
MSFMLEEKTIQFANFNITFGENDLQLFLRAGDV